MVTAANTDWAHEWRSVNDEVDADNESNPYELPVVGMRVSGTRARLRSFGVSWYVGTGNH